MKPDMNKEIGRITVNFTILSIKKTRIVVEWPSQPVDRMISLSPIIYIPFIIGTGMIFPLFDSFSDFLTIYVIGLSNESNSYSLYFP